MITPIIFTLDYEIFGDGSGDPLLFQIANTQRLCASLDLIDAKMTVYVEFGQISFFRSQNGKGKYKEYYEVICQQLKMLIKEGHDVQLHFHPSWEGAKLTEDGKLELTINDDISTIDYNVALAWLVNGKEFLETLLKPINAAYECIAYRAGAFTAGHQQKYIKLLVDAGLKIDSSVLPGGSLNSFYGNYDYRSIDGPNTYRIGESLVDKKDYGLLVEYPILTEVGLLSTMRYRNAHGIKNRRLMSANYKERITDKGTNQYLALVKKVLRGFAIADFNFLGANELSAIIAAQVAKETYNKYPMTLIGHSKFSFFNDELILLDMMLKAKRIAVKYMTVSEHYSTEYL